MKKLDNLLLKPFQLLSGWTYKFLSIDNYALGVVCLFLSMGVSILIAVLTFQQAAHDTIPKVAEVRRQTAVFGPIFCGMIAVYILMFWKDFRSMISRWHDLERPMGIVAKAFMWGRWGMLLFWLIPLFFGPWWSNSDLLLLNIGGMFFSCAPPSMDERMRKSFRKQEIDTF